MDNDAPLRQRRADYWRSVLKLTKVLLALWFLATVAVIWFARELSQITILGWPLSFYMAAQGIVLGYLALVGFYVWAMRRLDRRFHSGSSRHE